MVLSQNIVFPVNMFAPIKFNDRKISKVGHRIIVSDPYTEAAAKGGIS